MLGLLFGVQLMEAIEPWGREWHTDVILTETLCLRCRKLVQLLAGLVRQVCWQSLATNSLFVSCFKRRFGNIAERSSYVLPAGVSVHLRVSL